MSLGNPACSPCSAAGSMTSHSWSYRHSHSCVVSSALFVAGLRLLAHLGILDIGAPVTTLTAAVHNQVCTPISNSVRGPDGCSANGIESHNENLRHLHQTIETESSACASAISVGARGPVSPRTPDILDSPVDITTSTRRPPHSLVQRCMKRS